MGKDSRTATTKVPGHRAATGGAGVVDARKSNGPAAPKERGGASVYPAHPLADRLPKMSPAEYEALKASIEANGQIDPIVMLDGKILDGRHRRRACAELGREPKVIEFDRATMGEPEEFVVARANHRNMSDGQKCWSAAQFAADLARLSKPGPKPKDDRSSAANSHKSSDVAALRFGVSPRNVEYAKELMVKAPSLFAKLGADRTYNVNRAMQECRRDSRQREIRRTVKAASGDLRDCRLILGDVVERLGELPKQSARVVFADPPYNLGKHYHGNKNGDALTDDKFLAWCGQWLAECARVLAADGSLFVMMTSRYAARVEVILRGLGLHWRNTIYWWENNPENQRGNFSDAVRPVHYFTKSASEFLFFDDVKVDSRRNVIGDKRGLDGGKLPDNVWIDCRIPGNARDRVPYKDAPPQLPVAIPERCILVASGRGDTVLDPFNGNGTTAIAALANGRKYVGIDQSEKYLAQSKQWIKAQLAVRAGEVEAKSA